jgi:hypothetical protein
LLNFYTSSQKKYLILLSVFFLTLTYVIKGFFGIYTVFLISAITLIPLGVLQVITKDAISSVFYFILILTFGSLIAEQYQIWFGLILILIILLILILKFNKFKLLVHSNYSKLLSNQLIDTIGWFFIFSFILFLGGYDSEGFFVYDTLHPTYSLSIGQSFSTSIIGAPDLSYAGKELRYNPLFEATPIFLSNILNIPLLSVVYFEEKFMLTILTFITVNSFFEQHLRIKVPILVLFFLPVYSLQFYFSETIFNRSIDFTLSYHISFLLIVIAIHLLIGRRYMLLTLVSIALLNIKAMYFVTLMGGLVLFFLRNKNYKQLFLLFTLAIPVVAIFHSLFLSGSANEALWLVFPQIIYERIPSVFFGQEVNFEFNRWITLWISIVFLYVAIYEYIKNKADDTILILSSIALSGFLGIMLVTEVVTLSSRHFYNAAAFPMILVFYYSFKKRYLPNYRNSTINIVLVIFYIAWSSLIVSYLIEPELNSLTLALFILLCLGLIFFLIKNLPNSRKFVEYFIWVMVAVTLVTKVVNNVVINRFIADIFIEKPIETIVNNKVKDKMFSDELLNGYLWLNKNTEANSIVLFGSHYDLQTKSFIRSAVSGRQMYLEGVKYKGLGMQENFPLKMANSIYFYETFVKLGGFSKRIMQKIKSDDYHFVEPGFYKRSLEIERDSSLKAKALHTLSFGKDWSWINMPSKINNRVNFYLSELRKMSEQDAKTWLKYFIVEYSIDYIVLESGDIPRDNLKLLTSVLYQDKGFSILKTKI